MLKKMLNAVRVEVSLTPLDPLLVKSGQASVSGADMAFVRTYRSSGEPEPFLPGSSLKGVVRSYAEKICRSLKDRPVPVCLPYLKPDDARGDEARQGSCGLWLEKHKRDRNRDSAPNPDVYRLCCPACRLFGCHSFVGRFAVSDGYVCDGSWNLETRDGVAIDRFTGGAAAQAKYDLEVLTGGKFRAEIEVRNFERWQLGLVALVLRDMEDGLVRVGSGKSRGLGRVTAEIDSFVVRYYGREVEHLTGLWGLCSDEERRAYGLHAEESAGAPLPPGERRGLRLEHEIKDRWKEAAEAGVSDLTAFLEASRWPEPLESYRIP